MQFAIAIIYLFIPNKWLESHYNNPIIYVKRAVFKQITQWFPD